MKRHYPVLTLVLLQCPTLFSQMLAVDRGGPEAGGNGSQAVRLGRTGSPGFVGDQFTLGKQGEVWIIDSIRTYSMREGNTPIEEEYEKTMLFGGIAISPPASGQPPQPECDCHNLMMIQSNLIGKRVDARADGAASRIGPNLWQIEFSNLHWSVPGGVPIQFGVTASPSPSTTGKPTPWFNRGSATSDKHELRVFDEKGKQDALAGMVVDPAVGIDVQVRAHKMAPLSIRVKGATIVVTVPGSEIFDPRRIDISSLRFGPANTTPESSRLAVSEEGTELTVTFNRAATGLRGNLLSVCLNGREQGGPPFEGCNQLKSQ